MLRFLLAVAVVLAAVAPARAQQPAASPSSPTLDFEIFKSRVIAGKPEISKLLRHPLAESAGGDPHHDGGKHWTSKDDPEWQMLAAWVKGGTLSGSPASHGNVRIIQTNSAGDNVHIIDPATNKVVGTITGI